MPGGGPGSSRFCLPWLAGWLGCWPGSALLSSRVSGPLALWASATLLKSVTHSLSCVCPACPCPSCGTQCWPKDQKTGARAEMESGWRPGVLVHSLSWVVRAQVRPRQGMPLARAGDGALGIGCRGTFSTSRPKTQVDALAHLTPPPHTTARQHSTEDVTPYSANSSLDGQDGHP